MRRAAAINIIVDSSDKVGGDQYKYIAEKSVEDLGIGGSVETIALYIRPEIPLFIISIRYRDFRGKNTIGELASIDARTGSVRIRLDSEIDLGDALKVLWSEYGRERVEQAGRMEIVVQGVEPEEVQRIKIREKAVDISSRISELSSRIIPEGFRVRSVKTGENILTVIAAEDPIKEEWKAEALKTEAMGNA
uniref:Methanogenesis marker 17 protein n=1 Tax=Candidatus Methanomethylicus mesodigestus TaxID=1867258 RepID=A0A7C3J3M9_9CREN